MAEQQMKILFFPGAAADEKDSALPAHFSTIAEQLGAKALIHYATHSAGRALRCISPGDVLFIDHNLPEYLAQRQKEAEQWAESSAVVIDPDLPTDIIRGIILGAEALKKTAVFMATDSAAQANAREQFGLTETVYLLDDLLQDSQPLLAAIQRTGQSKQPT